MTPGWKLATLISGTGTPTSKDRELPLFAENLLSHWDALHAGGRSAQPSSRVSGPLTAQERDVLAMISQGLSPIGGYAEQCFQLRFSEKTRSRHR